MVKYNSFCLSLQSPVFPKMLCGDFKEKTDKRIELDDGEEKALRTVMELACGCEEGVRMRGVGDMMELGAIADKYGMEAVVFAVEEAVVRSVTKGEQRSDVLEMIRLGESATQYGMEAVVSAVEEAVVRSLTVETCGEVIRLGGGGQLPRAESAACTLALQHFEAVSRCGGFLGLNEEVMCSLVGDDDLMAREEAVLEAVAGWIQAGGGEVGRGERLLGLIRYGLLTVLRLAVVGLRVEKIVGEGLGARLRALTKAALAQLLLLEAAQEGSLLCSRAFEPQVRM